MIEIILAEFARSDFDFREFANPHDPLARLFPEWVPYYRLKFAIAKALQPQSILEVGVRFGYSAATFLKASPTAKFVGIDLDADSFGDKIGALEWARRITATHRAEFLVADSQRMERFPGGIYDLIHVDGRQDGAGTFHNLRRAVAQARWVLLDGYFWTDANFANANDFLRKYKDVVQYALTIPGYAGEMLLRVSDDYRESTQPTDRKRTGSAQLASFYDANYYLSDCGGHVTFQESRGRELFDPRLQSMLVLTRMGDGRAVLDLGCGRGEIAYQLAINGVKVTAVDYSPAAIQIAEGCFAPGETARDNVTFVCGDAGALTPAGEFGTVLAGDLIEHLSDLELERLYALVAQHLDETGVFVIHTAPNLWRYKRDYPRRRLAVERLGGTLPAEPRTRHELLMHINEQSPARLRRMLAKFFPHVKVWLGSPEDPVGSLGRKFTLNEATSAPGIYALASRAPLDPARVRALLVMAAVPLGEHGRFSVRLQNKPDEVTAATMFVVEIIVANDSSQFVSSMLPHPVNLSYHWSTRAKDRFVVFDGRRTRLPYGIAAGEKRRFGLAVQAPSEEGSFLLTARLVQEGCSWFESSPGFIAAEAVVRVVRP